MTFQRENPEYLAEKFIKDVNFIKESISNIQDEKTLNTICSTLNYCNSILRQIEEFEDEDTDVDLYEKCKNAEMEFSFSKRHWQSILDKKKKEILTRDSLTKQSEELANMTEEQRLEMQKKDDQEYFERQLKEIEEKKKFLLGTYSDDQETAETQEDQKMDEDQYLNKLIQESEEIKMKVCDKYTEDHEKIVRIYHEPEQKTTETQNEKNDPKPQENQKKCSIC